jgi:hypothetical protein
MYWYPNKPSVRSRPDDPERGSLLNQRYRIVEIISGMAAVYRAIDENLGVEALEENLFTTDNMPGNSGVKP